MEKREERSRARRERKKGRRIHLISQAEERSTREKLSTRGSFQLSVFRRLGPENARLLPFLRTHPEQTVDTCTCTYPRASPYTPIERPTESNEEENTSLAKICLHAPYASRYTDLARRLLANFAHLREEPTAKKRAEERTVSRPLVLMDSSLCPHD